MLNYNKKITKRPGMHAEVAEFHLKAVVRNKKTISSQSKSKRERERERSLHPLSHYVLLFQLDVCV